MRSLLKISTLSLGLILLSSSATGAITPDFTSAKEINRMLVQVKHEAVQLKQDSEALVSYTYLNIDRTGHACANEKVRADINDIARDVAKMERLSPSGLPRQQEAIGRIRVVVADLVANESAAIEALNHGVCLSATDYSAYLKMNSTLSDRLLTEVKQDVQGGEADH